MSRRDSKASATRIRRIAFNRAKYGRELLIDVAWVHEMPTFITSGAHALEFYDVILVTKGRGTFALDGVRHPVRPGQIFFTMPGQVRDWDVDRLDGLCLFFVDGFIREFLQDDDFLRRLPCFQTSPEGAAMFLTPSIARRIRSRMTAMRRELNADRRDSIALLRAQLHETLILIAREYAEVYGVPTRRPTHPAISRFVELVERDAAEGRAVTDYAKNAGVSAGHLNALSHEFLGLSAKAYVSEAITVRARRLLLYSDRSAAQIATALGFEDASYFTRFFRRQTGQTPSAFRRLAHTGVGKSKQQPG